MKVDIEWEPKTNLMPYEEQREWEAIASAAVGDGPGSLSVLFVFRRDAWVLESAMWGQADRDGIRTLYGDQVASYAAAIVKALAERGKAVREGPARSATTAGGAYDETADRFATAPNTKG